MSPVDGEVKGTEAMRLDAGLGGFTAGIEFKRYRGLSDLIFAPGRSFLLTFDFIANFLVFVTAMELTPRIASMSSQFGLVLIGAVFAFIFAMFGLGTGYYERARRFVISNIVVVGFCTGIVATIGALVTQYFVFYSVLGRFSFLYGFCASYAVQLVSRLFCRSYLLRHPCAFCVVGDSPHLAEFHRLGRPRERACDLYRFVDLELRAEDPHVEWLKRLFAAGVRVVVMTRSAVNSKPQVLDLLGGLYSYGIRVVDEIDFYSQMFERLPIDVVTRDSILYYGLDPRRYFTDAAKRAIDLGMSAAILVITAPVIGLIAALIKFTSPGPVLFLQPRMGRFGRPFYMYKFRTMYTEECRKDAGGGFTRAGDRRVTWIGRIIRPLHFDELPQLWNIFKGDMSLVGCRPEALSFAREMQRRLPLYEIRYLMRPGLTGHAQISQGYAMDTLEDTKHKLSFDLFYLVNHSLLLDIRIILRTAFVFAQKAR